MSIFNGCKKSKTQKKNLSLKCPPSQHKPINYTKKGKNKKFDWINKKQTPNLSNSKRSKAQYTKKISSIKSIYTVDMISMKNNHRFRTNHQKWYQMQCQFSKRNYNTTEKSLDYKKIQQNYDLFTNLLCTESIKLSLFFLVCEIVRI